MEQHTFRRRGLGLRGVDEQRVSAGYVLYTPLTSRTAHLISTSGEEVHRWTLPHRAGRHARILPNGNLAYNGAYPDSPNLFPMWKKYCGGVMMQVDSTGNIVRRYTDPHAHHDQNHLDDGTLLYTTLEPLTPEEAARVRGGIPGSEAPDGTVYADCIKHVDPWSVSTDSSSADFEADGKGGAKLLWSWRAIDHLDFDKFPQHQDYPREHWPLINSVSRDSEGNIIASSRNTSSVFVISCETGKVLWRLTAPVVNQQHCAHEINSRGDMLILDNGVFRPGLAVPFSRAIIVSRTTKQITWEYKDRSTGGIGFFTPFMGSAQKLENGNVLIAEAATGRIIEVTEGGEVVWEFVVPQLNDYRRVMGERELEEMEKIGFSYESNAIFRAYKYRLEDLPWLPRQ
ncbi:ASST-domain-containing protein [Aspergillus lucknowensis]|uniref:ASST-domain-containing protein n=1 Tax=Aspergillus lucknowensis TaxID=176173 RepID=A0ABR4M2Q7_9EURO